MSLTAQLAVRRPQSLQSSPVPHLEVCRHQQGSFLQLYIIFILLLVQAAGQVQEQIQEQRQLWNMFTGQQLINSFAKVLKNVT